MGSSVSLWLELIFVRMECSEGRTGQAPRQKGSCEGSVGVGAALPPIRSKLERQLSPGDTLSGGLAPSFVVLFDRLSPVLVCEIGPVVLVEARRVLQHILW
jgi:hypothetical protein